MGIGYKIGTLEKMASGWRRSDNFYSVAPDRQKWLIKTGCRYIWEDPEVISVRNLLYMNITLQGIDAQGVVESSIENAMDRYFYRFNLTGLNELL
jgi:hypothetical protein